MFTQQHWLTVCSAGMKDSKASHSLLGNHWHAGGHLFHFRTLSCNIVCSTWTCHKSCLILHEWYEWAWTTTLSGFSWKIPVLRLGVRQEASSCLCLMSPVKTCSRGDSWACQYGLEPVILYFFSLLIALTWLHHWMRVSSHTCRGPLQVKTYKWSHSGSVWSHINFFSS